MEMPLAHQKQPEEHEKIWYHASDKEYESTDILPMSHFGTKDAARGRAASFSFTPEKGKHVKANIMAYRMKLKKGLEIEDDGGDHSPTDIVDMLHKKGHISSLEHHILYSKTNVSRTERPAAMQHIAHFLKAKGVDHLHYINSIEDKGSRSVIVVDPKQSIRPIFQNRRGRINFTRALMAQSG
jgi:hypothetical protein